MNLVSVTIQKASSEVVFFLATVLRNLSRPESELQENRLFNYYVSNVRIRSEHCMGFLKGRWSSLRGLRLRIDNKDQLIFASLWVITCIHFHCFAMDHEDGIEMTRGDATSFITKAVKLFRKSEQMQQWACPMTKEQQMI